MFYKQLYIYICNVISIMSRLNAKVCDVECPYLHAKYNEVRRVFVIAIAPPHSCATQARCYPHVLQCCRRATVLLSSPDSRGVRAWPLEGKVNELRRP